MKLPSCGILLVFFSQFNFSVYMLQLVPGGEGPET